MSTVKTRAISLFLTLVMIVSSLCLLAFASSANDLNEPVEYRDESGKIIGEEQGGYVRHVLGDAQPDMQLFNAGALARAAENPTITVDGLKESIYTNSLKGKYPLCLVIRVREMRSRAMFGFCVMIALFMCLLRHMIMRIVIFLTMLGYVLSAVSS